jgi:hypothetical protein
MHEGGASREATNDVLKKRFGEDQWVRYRTYYNIIRRGREHGDPCWKRPRKIAGRTLTDEHERTIFTTLESEPATMTCELQDELVRAEPPGGRTSAPLRPGASHYFPASTIDDRIRLRGFTLQVLSLYNERRDPRLSGVVRNALQQYSMWRLVFVDASPCRATDFQRKVGRAPRGKRARSRTTAMSNGGVLKTIMGVFTAAEAFVTGPTQILDGAVDYARYMEWAYTHLSVWLKPYHVVVL